MSILQKQASRDVLKKRCSEKMQQIYRRTLMKEYDFNKVAKNIYGRLLLILLFSNMIIGITGHSGIENFASRLGIIQNLYEFY